MHQKLGLQYEPCGCNKCKTLNLSIQEDNDFKRVLKVAERAFKKLHNRGTYKPEDLAEVKEYKLLAKATAKVLKKGIPHEVPQEMKDYLEKDVFIFSGLKTHAQLTEARSFLKDAEGNIRNYESFEQKVLKLNESYNRNYLEAEYNFAVQSGQSAADWLNFSDDTTRYYLQYRTAGDDRVRDSHKALHNITLPKDDPFWDYYYTPNGWRCRCRVIEVLAANNDKSNSKQAMAKGEKATALVDKEGNSSSLFKFNPGKDKKLMPPDNTYTKVVGAKKAIKYLE